MKMFFVHDFVLLCLSLQKFVEHLVRDHSKAVQLRWMWIGDLFSFYCRALQCVCSIVVVRHLCNSPNIDLTARSLSPSVINFEMNTIKAIVEEIVRAFVKCSREIVGMFQVEMSTTRTMNVKICKHGLVSSWVARLQHEFGMDSTGHFNHIDF